MTAADGTQLHEVSNADFFGHRSIPWLFVHWSRRTRGWFFRPLWTAHVQKVSGRISFYRMRQCVLMKKTFDAVVNAADVSGDLAVQFSDGRSSLPLGATWSIAILKFDSNANAVTSAGQCLSHLWAPGHAATHTTSARLVSATLLCMQPSVAAVIHAKNLTIAIHYCTGRPPAAINKQQHVPSHLVTR